MIWDGIERRKNNGRRKTDTCVFHQIVIDEVNKNRVDIKELRENLATKGDIKSLEEKVEKKADWKVLSLYIITSLSAFAIFAGAIIWEQRDEKKDLKEITSSVNIMNANQKILMRALHIQPVPESKPKEVKENEDKDDRENSFD